MEQSFLAGGKRIRLAAHEPSNPSKKLPAIILMHGAGGNVGFWLDRLAPHALSAGISVYAPHYFDRTGTVRAALATITDGVHVPQWLDTLHASIAHVSARPAVDLTRIALVGISLGAFLSLGYAAQLSASSEPAQHRAIRCIVEISGGLTEPFRSQATGHFPPTLILHGDQDSIVSLSEAQALDARLTELNVPHQKQILSGEGHWFSGPAQLRLLLAVVGFLQKAL